MVSKINKLLKLAEDPEHPSLGILIPLLKLSGQWHPDLKSPVQRLKLFLYCVIVAFFISQYIKCAIHFNFDSIKLLLQYAPFHMGIIKTLFFQKDYKSWEELVKFISTTERKQLVDKDENKDVIMKGYLQWSRGVTYFFYIFAFFANISIFTEPYQKNHVTENGTVYLYLFDGYTPFQREPPGYYYSMAIQTMIGYIMTSYIVAWDMTTVTIMIFFVGQLRMSSFYCSQVISIDAETSQKNIAECHKFHTTLVMYQRKFDALISPVMFIYLIIISVNLGVCIIQLAEIEDDLPTMLASLIYIVACLIQLLLFYWHANEVTVESECVSYNTFKSNWMEADCELQRQVMLLAYTTRKQLAFRAGPFNTMSLSTFVAILRSSYSFYTLLKGTNDGRSSHLENNQL